MEHSSPRLRALASLLLLFALNVVAHGTHQHKPELDRDAPHAVCGHCAAFDAVADAPVNAILHGAADWTRIRPAVRERSAVCVRSDCGAQPRAPPALS